MFQFGLKESSPSNTVQGYFKTDYYKSRQWLIYLKNLKMIYLLYEDCFDTKNMSDLRKSERNNQLHVEGYFWYSSFSELSAWSPSWLLQNAFKRQAWKLKSLASPDINSYWLNRYTLFIAWFFSVSQAISKSVSWEWWTWQLLCFLTSPSKLIRKENVANWLTWLI